MIRAISFLVALTFLRPALAQETSVQANIKKQQEKLIRENFKKLDFDWSLPPSIQHMMNSGLYSLDAGNWKLALGFFNKVIEFDKTFVPAYYFKYTSYEIGHRLSKDEPHRDFTYVIRNLPDSKQDLYVNLWDAFIPNRRQPRRYKPLLEVAPPLLYLSSYLVDHQGEVSKESFSYLTKGLSCLVAARFEEAHAFTDQALKVEPSACALYLKAAIYQFMSQGGNAVYLYEQTLSKDEKVLEAHENLAIYKQNLNDGPGTLGHLDSLNKYEPDSPAIWRFSGLLKVKIQYYQGAISDLAKYLKTDPTNFECLKQKGIAEFEAGDHVASIKDLYNALMVGHRDLEILLYISENHLQLGDSTQNVKVLKQARRLFPFNWRLDIYTADKLVNFNKTRQAHKIISRVGFWDCPKMVPVELIQCKIYLKKDKVEKALRALNTFIQTEGEQNDFSRANTFLMNGDKTHAKVYLENLIASMEASEENYFIFDNVLRHL